MPDYEAASAPHNVVRSFYFNAERLKTLLINTIPMKA
jgi:hypothetical protein